MIKLLRRVPAIAPVFGPVFNRAFARAVFASATVAILSLAALTIPESSPSAQAMPEIFRGAQDDIWDGRESRGDITHLESGVTFPAEFGDFKRFGLVAFGSGNDVSLRYRNGSSDTSAFVTVYLFRPADNPEHKLAGAITSLSFRKPGQFVWANGPFDVAADGQELQLFKGTYKLGIGPNTVMDYLYFGQLGAWTVKVRATLPSPREPEQEQAIDNMVRGLPWASLLAANGECSGSACNPPAATAFDHHQSEMMLSSIFSSDTERKLAGENPVLLYNAERDGVLWQVSSLDGRAIILFTSGFGALSIDRPLHVLTTGEGSELRILRFFTGTPDAELIETTIAGLEEAPEEDAFVPTAQSATYFTE